MISTLMLGLAASKAATASVTTLLEVLSQVASFRVTDSGAAAVEVLASLEAAAELLGAEAPQPASIVPTMEAASSMEMLFFIKFVLLTFLEPLVRFPLTLLLYPFFPSA